MAFSATKLAVNESGNTTGGGLHQYKDTAVTLPALSAAGYFNDAKALKDGDLLLLYGSDGIAFKTIDITSSVISLIPTDNTGYAANQVLVTAATYTPKVRQNGKTFILQKAAGVAVTLPAPAAGLKYRFIHGGPVLTSVGHVITTNGTNQKVFQGSVCHGGYIQLVALHDTITFVSGTSILGDWIEIEADGTNWYVSGLGSTDNAILGSDA